MSDDSTYPKPYHLFAGDPQDDGIPHGMHDYITGFETLAEAVTYWELHHHNLAAQVAHFDVNGNLEIICCLGDSYE